MRKHELSYKKRKTNAKNNSIHYRKREKNYLDNLRHGYYSDDERR